MKLVGRLVLEDLKVEHPDIAKRIDAWCLDIEASDWATPHEVKQRYNSVDFPGGNRAIFNIKGNQYRVLAKIDYQRKIVLIEKAGTHDEYNNWRIK
jgi:mRNA interferase HigB